MKLAINLHNKIFGSNIARATMIAVLLAVVTLLVQSGDEAHSSFIHLIYIPVILSAYYWGALGGVIVALFGTALISPLMPALISGETIQIGGSWLVRAIILSLVGLITGLLFERVAKLNIKLRNSYLIHPLTGAYNVNKLISDLWDRIRGGKNFAVISIKLTNLEQVSKYIDLRSLRQLLIEFLKELSAEYGSDSVYMTGFDEVDLLAPLKPAYLDKCLRLVDRYQSAVKVDEFTFKMIIKIGVYEYVGDMETPFEVYNKARIANEQGDPRESGIYFYDREFDLSRQEIIMISGSLLGAIKNNELYLVYQPKINIADNTIAGVEVLCRWDRKGKKPVGPNVFINIAEDMGFITEISKFVLDSSFHQISDWSSRGIVLDFSINFTANELLDNHLAEWEKRASESEHDIAPRLIIEITERALTQRIEEISERIDKLRAKGIKISIDDFGTGVNSLLRTTQFPYDEIKIDKYFIDKIFDLEIRNLVNEMIDHAHKFGRNVVAEGVETEEQLDVLRELGCDIVQGYYYSKPLLPEEFEEYYFKMQADQEADASLVLSSL